MSGMQKKEVKKVRVECSELELGMFVCELDRPWLDSPFLIQGFYINEPDELDQLRDVCDYVYVDKLVERKPVAHKGLGGGASKSAKVLSFKTKGGKPAQPGEKKKSATGSQPKPAGGAISEQVLEDFFPRKKKLTQYKETASWSDEASIAGTVVDILYAKVSKLLQSSVQVGQKIDFDAIKPAVAAMVDSVIRNPDAALWAVATRKPGNPDHDAAARAAVFAVMLGRRLGLPKEDLCSLGIGASLMDIGKLRLSEEILHADRKLAPEEIAMIKRHVEVGLNLFERKGMTDESVIECVASHHERLDGSGYPGALSGDDIPVFGRITGLVDCYNAITGSRKYAESQSPSEAINELYKLKGVHFHSDLVDEFIHALGVYPVGALVELSTGEVAVSVAQSPTRRLRPVVMKLLDKDKRPLAKPEKVELEHETHTMAGAKLDIVKSLPSRCYSVDLASFKF